MLSENMCRALLSLGARVPIEKAALDALERQYGEIGAKKGAVAADVLTGAFVDSQSAYAGIG